MTDKTMTFRIGDDHEDVMKETLTEVFDALQEKGYNPINQIVGYILTEDPTYITTHNNARSLMRRAFGCNGKVLSRLKLKEGYLWQKARRKKSLNTKVSLW